MSKFNEQHMALAEVYADSLLRAARKTGTQDDVTAEILDLVAYMDQHPDFDAFLTSPGIDDDDRSTTLEKLFRGKMSDLVLNTLLVLNRRNRAGVVREVARAVQLRTEEAHHQQEVTVETATPLTDDLKAKLKDALSRRIGREALLIEKIRPELIGGVVVHIGDQQLDASLRSSIHAMQLRLTDRASHEIHRGEGRYVSET